MTKYVVSGFRFYEEFLSQSRAKARFDEVKNNFTYCELKKVHETASGYYSTSLEIFRK